jgi:hypothetical protein
MSADGFTTVHVTTDPVEGEMLAEALRGEAIDARVEHVNGALLGAGPQLFEIRVLVADDSVAQARAILEDLRHPALAEELSAAPADGVEATPPAARDPRKVGIGLLLPGAGHFYARRPWTALTLEAGLLYALASLRFGPGTDFASNLWFASLFAIVAADIAGAWLAVKRGGDVLSPEGQVSRGVALLVCAAAASGVVATVVAVPGWLRARDLEKLRVSCTDQAVTIWNTGTRDRYVSLDKAGTTAFDLGSGGVYHANVADTGIVRLAAGAKLVREVAADPHEVERCRTSVGQDSNCGLRFELTVQDVEPSASAQTVWGRCSLDWSGAHAELPATLVRDDDRRP